MGCVLPTAMGAAIDELPVQRAGSGSALIQALRQAGDTIGVVILGTVLITSVSEQPRRAGRLAVQRWCDAGGGGSDNPGQTTAHPRNS